MPTQYGSLPFREQIKFFRDKLNVPTRAWTDIWRDAHDTAFMVAGAYKAELVADLREAVRRGIDQGTTIQQFRKDFDSIVAKTGWSYSGTRGFRTRIIYETNLRTSYQSGRYAQLKDPTLLQSRPYWRYVHSDFVATPRPDHVAWDGLVLRHDDPWWRAHFPPNGWGCKCKIYAESDRTLRMLGKGGSDRTPIVEYETKPAGQRGLVSVPKGVDPGWDYTPGATVSNQLRNQIEQRIIPALPKEIATDLAKTVNAIPLPPRAPLPVTTLDDYIGAGKDIDALLQTQSKLGGVIDHAMYRARLLDELERQTGRMNQATVQGSGRGAQLIREASQLYPNAWTDLSNMRGTVRAKSSKGRGFHRFLGGDSVISVQSLSNGVHEYGHRLQSVFKPLDDLFQELHKLRTQGEPLKKLSTLTGDRGYGSTEVTREDRYVRAYYGREYPLGGALEVLAMAMEYTLGGNPNDLKLLREKDPELLHLVLGLLFNWKP